MTQSLSTRREKVSEFAELPEVVGHPNNGTCREESHVSDDRELSILGFSPTEVSNFTLVLDKNTGLSKSDELNDREQNRERVLSFQEELERRRKFEAELLKRNVKMLNEYLKRNILLNAHDINRMSGSKSSRESEPSSRWKRDGKIFAIRDRGLNLFPSFQFRDGIPLPVIKKVLTIIGEKFSPWQIACWFEGGNGWLGGDAPQNCLEKPDVVIVAAQRFMNPVIG